MKAVLTVLCLAAAPAVADLSVPFGGPGARDLGRIITATNPIPLGEDPGLRGGTDAYNSVGPGLGGFFASPPAVGPLGFDDYSAAIASPTVTSLQFVGGVSQANGVLWISFFSTGGSFLDSRGVQLSQAGNFIWTINLSTPLSLPTAGIMQITANSTNTAVPTTIGGQFFLTTPDAVTVGGNSPGFGGGSTSLGGALVHAFSLTTPEPTTLVLLAGGLLCLIRRR